MRDDPNTFVIAATGPSLTLAQCRQIAMAKVKCPSITVIAVNDAVYPLWFADIVYACDAQWWEYHQGLPGFRGMKIRLRHFDERGREKNQVSYEDVDAVESTGTDGADFRPGFVRTGGNSGYQAIQVAVHLGAKSIVLVGFDMNPKVYTHWFGPHPAAISNQPNVRGWNIRMNALAAALKDRGVRCVNASPQSAITAFPIVDLAGELPRGARS